MDCSGRVRWQQSSSLEQGGRQAGADTLFVHYACCPRSRAWWMTECHESQRRDRPEGDPITALLASRDRISPATQDTLAQRIIPYARWRIHALLPLCRLVFSTHVLHQEISRDVS